MKIIYTNDFIYNNNTIQDDYDGELPSACKDSCVYYK